MTRLPRFCLILSVVLFISAVCIPAQGRRIDEQTLKALRGGELRYCLMVMPMGNGCNGCTFIRLCQGWINGVLVSYMTYKIGRAHV